MRYLLRRESAIVEFQSVYSDERKLPISGLTPLRVSLFPALGRAIRLSVGLDERRLPKGIAIGPIIMQIRIELRSVFRLGILCGTGLVPWAIGAQQNSSDEVTRIPRCRQADEHSADWPQT